MALAQRGHRPGAPRTYALVTLEDEQAAVIVERLGATGIRVALIVPWGDCAGYARIQRSHSGLILLHWCGLPLGTMLTRHVSALSTLGSVVVLTDIPVDVAELLGAGAYDVLNYQAPAVELRARIGAHARRLNREVRVYTPPRLTTPAWSSQRFLLEWLRERPASFCCHDLRVLLGRPGHPLSLPSLRRRLARVTWLLREQNLDLLEDRFWGSATYRVVEATAAEPRRRDLSHA